MNWQKALPMIGFQKKATCARKAQAADFVELEGFEPSSSQSIDKLSTCLVNRRVSGNNRPINLRVRPLASSYFTYPYGDTLSRLA